MLANCTVQTTIPYRDYNRVRQYYETTLGLALSQEIDGNVFYTCGGGTGFMLYPSNFAGTAQNTAMSFMTDNIEAEVSELRTRGVVFEEYDYPDLKTVNGIAEISEGWVAWFKDTEGNTIAVTQVRG